MLSRRHLRIRVMQALYAYYQSESRDTRATEQEILNGTRKIYELYLFLLQFYLELSHQEEVYFADQQTSMLTGKKKEAVHLMKDNAVFAWLHTHGQFAEQLKKYKINWQSETDLLKQTFFQLRQKQQYIDYTASTEQNLNSDIAFAEWLLKELVLDNEVVRHMLEERSIYWAESVELATGMIQKMVEAGKKDGLFRLSPLFKDEEDDVKFMQDLIQKTIRDDEYFHQLISDKTKNWDAERIALVDIILMKMALCEILNLSTIPIKVSINEYIDISKDYSTPNSKGFINGVIDKLVIELKEQGKITKTGRGLLE